MTDTHFYEPAQGHGLPHDPFNAIVGPRPIGWISTRSQDGLLNLAPYSFFNAFNYTPPLVGFASIGAKDTLRNAQDTGEFVWNLATRELAEAMNASSATVAAEIDEFVLAGLEKAPSNMVAPPRVAASPVQFECLVTQIIQLKGKADEALEQWLVLGEAVGIHIDHGLIEDGVYRTSSARPIMRGGGPADYFEVSEDQLFHMFRPT